MFWKIYNDTLREIWQETQKKIGVPEDILERINEQRSTDQSYQEAYRQYLSIQKEIIGVPGTLKEVVNLKKNLLFTH